MRSAWFVATRKGSTSSSATFMNNKTIRLGFSFCHLLPDMGLLFSIHE